MTMWYLEGFDRETEWLVREHPLPNLDAGTIRRVLKVYDDLPIEPFAFDIPTWEALYELAKYGDEPIEIDESLHYGLGSYVD
jgi:hypothetical protein